MKQKLHTIIALCLILSLGLVGCAAPADSSIDDVPADASSAPADISPADASTGESSPSKLPPTTIEDGSITDEWETKGLFVPTEATTTTITSYPILEGTEMENDIVVLTAEEEGPTVFIIASVHGDEIAAYEAANRMKNMELASGTLYILSPANVVGAENNRRFVYDKQDLNRSFPGKTDGTEAELIAHTIFEEIKRIQPDFVFDLHEARIKTENRDFLGSSFIFTSLDGMEDMFLDMYMATQSGDLCSEPYNFFSPGPSNSVNRTITEELGIPVITVETYRAYQLERRIEDQMASVGYVLEYMGLV